MLMVCSLLLPNVRSETVYRPKEGERFFYMDYIYDQPSNLYHA